MLESEYRLCRDFQRGKQLSEKQLAQLRTSGFLEQPLCPADIEARPPDFAVSVLCRARRNCKSLKLSGYTIRRISAALLAHQEKP